MKAALLSMLILTTLILPVLLVLYLIRQPQAGKPGMTTGLFAGILVGIALFGLSFIPAMKELLGQAPTLQGTHTHEIIHWGIGFLLFSLCLQSNWRHLLRNQAQSLLTSLSASIISPLLIALILWLGGTILNWNLEFSHALLLGLLLSLIDVRPLLNNPKRHKLSTRLRLLLKSDMLLSTILLLSGIAITLAFTEGQLERNLEGLGIQLGILIIGGLLVGAFVAFFAKELLILCRRFEIKILTLAAAYLLIMMICQKLGFSYIPDMIVLGLYLAGSLDHHVQLKPDRQKLRQFTLFLENGLAAFITAWLIWQWTATPFEWNMVPVVLLLVILPLLGRLISMALVFAPRFILKRGPLNDGILFSFGPARTLLPLLLAMLVPTFISPDHPSVLIGLTAVILSSLLIQTPLLPIISIFALSQPKPKDNKTDAGETMTPVDIEASDETTVPETIEANSETTSDLVLPIEEPLAELTAGPLDLTPLDSDNNTSSIFIESSQTEIPEGEAPANIDPEGETETDPESDESNIEVMEDKPEVEAFTDDEEEEPSHPLIPVIQEERGDRDFGPYRIDLKEERSGALLEDDDTDEDEPSPTPEAEDIITDDVEEELTPEINHPVEVASKEDHPSSDELSDALKQLNTEPPTSIFDPPATLNLDHLVEEQGQLDDEELAAFKEHTESFPSHLIDHDSTDIESDDAIEDIEYEDIDDDPTQSDPDTKI